MPPLQNTDAGESPALVQGPDVISGRYYPDMEQAGINGNFVGLREWERLLVTTATSPSIGFNFHKRITQSFRKIFTG